MSVQSRLISFTALELVFSAGFLPANAMSSCITNDCAALGYTITDTSKCTGNIIRCPYDKSKAYCVSDTCGDKFYGITQCPANATCKTAKSAESHTKKQLPATRIMSLTLTNGAASLTFVPRDMPEPQLTAALPAPRDGNSAATVRKQPLPETNAINVSRNIVTLVHITLAHV